MKFPKSVDRVIQGFESLPGIGPKTAERLTMHLLKMDDDKIDRFAESLKNFKKNTKICTSCFNISENETCSICNDFSRDRTIICVIETPMDLVAIEKSNYKGLYHVLHGLINPMQGISPSDLYLNELFDRINNTEEKKVEEVILAINTTLEGEATSMYIKERLKKFNNKVQLSRIGIGLPIGATIEYADQNTLKNALDSRISY